MHIVGLVFRDESVGVNLVYSFVVCKKQPLAPDNNDPTTNFVSSKTKDVACAGLCEIGISKYSVDTQPVGSSYLSSREKFMER